MLLSMRWCVTSLNLVRASEKSKLKPFLGYALHHPSEVLQFKMLHLKSYSYTQKTRTAGQLEGPTKCLQRNCWFSETFRGPVYMYTRGLKSKSSVTNVGLPQGIHENISALQMKTRVQRRKRPAIEEEDTKKHGYWNVVAYATAEEYDLAKMTKALLEQNLYVPVPQVKSVTERNQAVADVLHVTARYQVGDEPREIYFFREGTTVFWNVPELEASNVLGFIRQFEDNSYDERLVQYESEIMSYTHAVGKKSHLLEGDLVVGDEGNVELDKYTFSNAVSLSVKLGIWEASLNRYVDSIEYVTEDLKQGHKIKISQEEVLRKTGELFALRHVINLSSDLLDTPDFYWDNEEQENLYQQLCSYFSISRRTRVMNEKLNHCVELVELLSSHLSDKHHIRLEWMIIVLIMVEVGFEIIHYVDRYL